MSDPRAAFIEAAVWHGTLERAVAILAAHPEIASSDIHSAAILGDDAAVRRFLELDPGNATVKGGPRGWDALTHLCFSKYLRLDRARSAGFVRAARALLDAGASANTGWYETDHRPEPEWESALYGAAGVAHHAELTRLLLERGADPNDEETPYHAPEGHDNEALKVLVESGKLTAESLGMILLRKADWHDAAGIKWLLERGVDPNRQTRWGKTALHNAVLRDNALEIVELLLDHGADPALIADHPGRSAAAIGAITSREPQLVREVLAEGGKLLAEFAGNWNTEWVGHLLDLGVPVTALYEGDGYFDIAQGSTALHVAAWKGLPPTVQLLIERGAPIDAKDGKGRTPLALAVKACVDSYWTYRRTPETVRALLEAGASVSGVAVPSGY